MLSFPNLLAYWVQHFHSIIFQDLKLLNWNSITSTSFVRSDAFLRPTWLHILGCLALGEWSHHCDYGSWSSFLYRFSVYSCHLFLISFTYVRSLPFLSFLVPILAWNVPLISLIFLKKSLVFLILFFFSISLHYSLKKTFLSFLSILWNSAFRWVYLSFTPLPLASLLFSAICKASSDNHFAFLHFSWQ